MKHRLGDPLGDMSKVADALDVPPRFLIGGAVCVSALLVIAVVAKTTASSVVSAVAGLGIVALGIRAIARPVRPFRPDFSGLPYINTSRRVGAFCVLAGLVWILISLATPHSS